MWLMGPTRRWMGLFAAEERTWRRAKRRIKGSCCALHRAKGHILLMDLMMASSIKGILLACEGPWFVAADN